MFCEKIMFYIVTLPFIDLLNVYFLLTLKSKVAIQLSGCFPIFECHKPYNAHRPQCGKGFQKSNSGDVECVSFLKKYLKLTCPKEQHRAVTWLHYAHYGHYDEHCSYKAEALLAEE